MSTGAQLIEKLMNSFEVLDQAIEGARVKLSARGKIPSEVFKRLDSYRGIVSSQRNLALELLNDIKNHQPAELMRKIQLIAAMSEMIMRDAKDTIASLQGLNSAVADDEINFC